MNSVLLMTMLVTHSPVYVLNLTSWEAVINASSPSRPSVSLQSYDPPESLIPHLMLNPVFYTITPLTSHTYIFSKDFSC